MVPALGVAALALLIPAHALAHAFGVQFTLPLPVDFYVAGGVLAFIASCVAMLFFSGPEPAAPEYSKLVPLRAGRVRVRAFGAAGFAFGALVVYVGIFGAQDYVRNPVPNFFWILFLLLFSYFMAIVGGLWQYIDPFRWIASFFADRRSHRAVPAWMRYFPTILFFGLLWLELFSPGWGSAPVVLSALCIAYAILCVVMSRVYGLEAWFGTGDYFSAFFGLIGKIAPIQFREGGVYIAPPGERLAHEKPAHLGVLLFILVVLGSTVVDGLRETRVWWDFVFAMRLTDSVVFYFSELALLFAMPFLLFGLYALALFATKMLARSSLSLRELLRSFAYSLVPIAVAYHFAHYFSLILSGGQNFIAQLSDPLARGWDLFGTAGRAMNPALVGADTVWYIQLGAIVIGHILAAFVAHRIARRIFSSARRVILSELPLLVLMVGYTAFGLWTLAQPFMTGA